MIRQLKFNTKNQNVYFLSDLHWHHDPKWDVPIWKSRGFSSLEESDEYAINKINEIVKPNDVLFSGGDLTLNCSEELFEDFISKLNCQNIWCLWGNHPNPMRKIYQREIKSWLQCNDEGYTSKNGANIAFDNHCDVEMYPFRYKNIVFAGDYLEMIIDGKIVILFHYPLAIWNHMKDLAYALVGHSHHGFEGSLPSNLTNKILDIGWDGYLKPLKFQEIQEIMSKKQYLKIDKTH